MVRVFISSVQKEFSEERKALVKYIREDVLLCKFFQPFIFEELPAINLSAPEAYLSEAAQSEIYLGIFGKEYGYEDAEGVSPTEREYDTAVQNNKHRLIFVKRVEDRDPKEAAFVKRVESQIVRKSFTDFDGLRTNVYAALVRFLEEKEYLRLLPWDATMSNGATLADLDEKKIEDFVALARKKRGFKLEYTGDNTLDILIALNLATEAGRITNAALLLFAKNPQRYFVSSVVKCMVFPTNIMTKPILSHQVYQGTLFELVDAAKGFVMQHIDASVSIRNNSAIADVDYEIPMAAVAEAVVNACVHRSYESNGSVQVMLFKDRLEVWNPGTLPYSMTTTKLKQRHSSIPVNPILAVPAFLAGYIEHSGTGTTDIVNYCKKAGLREPDFIQDEDFRVVIWRKGAKTDGPLLNNAESGFSTNGPLNEPQNGPLNEPQNKQGDSTLNEKKVEQYQRYRKLIETLIGNPKISKKELAETLGVGLTTIKRDITSLRESYRIEWVGHAKTGRWEIEQLK